MSDQPEELDFEERRKRLEQLFAAEPHLSPTMRARQLYDEPESHSNGHLPAESRSSGIPEPEGLGSGMPAVARAAQAPIAELTDSLMSLESARTELRQRATSTDSAERERDALDRLRDDLLAKWRRDCYSDR